MTIVAFLDRDGTLNEEKGYIRKIEDLELIAGAAKAIKKLNDAGVLTILTTNQTGAARGFYNEEHINGLNERLQDLLDVQAGAYLDAVYYCPHIPPDDRKELVAKYVANCDCRKPQTGMINQAVEAFDDIDLKKSFVLGDKASDVELAVNAGCQSILLRTGYGARVLEGKYQVLHHQPDFICDSIVDAADVILDSVGE